MSLLVDPSPQESCPREVPASPCNDHDRELVSSVNEGLLVDEALHDWYDPLLSLYTRIKVSHQEIIPHHLAIPGLVSLNFVVAL